MLVELKEVVPEDPLPATPRDLASGVTGFCGFLADVTCLARGEEDEFSLRKLLSLPGVRKWGLCGDSGTLSSARTGVGVTLCAPCLNADEITGGLFLYDTALLRTSERGGTAGVEDGYGFGRDVALGGIGGGGFEFSDATRSSSSVGSVRPTDRDLAPTLDLGDADLTRLGKLCSWLRFRTRPCEQRSSKLFPTSAAKRPAER